MLGKLFTGTLVAGAISVVGVVMSFSGHDGIELASRPNPVFAFPPSVMRDVPTDVPEPTTSPTHLTKIKSKPVYTGVTLVPTHRGTVVLRSHQRPANKIEPQTLPRTPESHSIKPARHTEPTRTTSAAPVPTVSETHDPVVPTVTPSAPEPSVSEPRLKVCEHNKKPKKCKED